MVQEWRYDNCGRLFSGELDKNLDFIVINFMNLQFCPLCHCALIYHFNCLFLQIVNGNNLKILGCLGSDTAMYQCFGTNPSGNVQASVHLRVLKKGNNSQIHY